MTTSRFNSINAQAERLLNIQSGQLVRGRPVRELVQSSDLEEAVHSVLRHQLPRRRSGPGQDPIEGQPLLREGMDLWRCG